MTAEEVITAIQKSIGRRLNDDGPGRDHKWADEAAENALEAYVDARIDEKIHRAFDRAGMEDLL